MEPCNLLTNIPASSEHLSVYSLKNLFEWLIAFSLFVPIVNTKTLTVFASIASKWFVEKRTSSLCKLKALFWRLRCVLRLALLLEWLSAALSFSYRPRFVTLLVHTSTIDASFYSHPARFYHNVKQDTNLEAPLSWNARFSFIRVTIFFLLGGKISITPSTVRCPFFVSRFCVLSTCFFL